MLTYTGAIQTFTLEMSITIWVKSRIPQEYDKYYRLFYTLPSESISLLALSRTDNTSRRRQGRPKGQATHVRALGLKILGEKKTLKN
jgi:hypothetical protein